MPFNLPGTLVPFYALFNPRLLHPHVSVADIRQLNFAALRSAGFRGAVFDKDNCLTIPHKDALVPELKDAWDECLATFGPDNVLIVSNSAGSKLDPGEFQAESVSWHLRVPVLRHRAMKPSYAAVDDIRAYFASLPAPLAPQDLIVVGDRVFTDTVLAKRLSHPSTVFSRIAHRLRLSSHPALPNRPAGDFEKGEGRVDGPLAVWTTGVWQRESMAFRWAEGKLVQLVERLAPEAREIREENERRFVIPPAAPEPKPKDTEPPGRPWISRAWQWTGRSSWGRYGG
ncbi:HAD-superfamily phosphatase [Peniophora sp. CONT]|nr:HAD-superfamily phosphatase [Peniophora sp. CONT]